MDDFACHVKVMHTDGDYRFNQEFEVSEYCLAFLLFKQLASFQCYYSLLVTVCLRKGEKIEDLCLSLVSTFDRILY